MATTYDVLVIGGGLSGLTCALQILRQRPTTRLAILERSTFPLQESVGKVGESSVEIAAHYFGHVLGLADHLEQQQLPKLGLRYFLEAAPGARLEQRLEVGTNRFAPTPSFQIDRARLENHLYDQVIAYGATVYCGETVREVQIDPDGHQVRIGGNDQPLHCRWLIDASGRTAVVRKHLGLQEKTAHQGTSVWWRMKGEWRIDDWCDDPQWKVNNGPDNARWFSTNHLMGEGYWVWVIPLASGATSFGIVADPRLHPFSELHTFEKAMLWLDRHEPEVSRRVRAQQDALLDFTGMKNYSHGCTKVMSSQRWALTGEAGLFIDPFYSPGSDFIALANTYITDLVTRDLDGEQVGQRAEIYNELYLRFARSTTSTFDLQYPILGNPVVLPIKVFWDWCFYWHFFARLFFEEKMIDLRFISKARSDFERLQLLGNQMQALLRLWNTLERPVAKAGFLDLAKHPALLRLNKSLLERDRLISGEEQFARDVDALLQLAQEITAYFTDRTGAEVPVELAAVLATRVPQNPDTAVRNATEERAPREGIISSFLAELESFLLGQCDGRLQNAVAEADEGEHRESHAAANSL